MSDTIKKGKLDASGQAKRRQQIIDYIREHEPARSKDIRQALFMPRSSFLDDVKYLKESGAVISEKTGIYRIHPDYQTESAGIRIDRKILRQWLITALLSEQERSLKELGNALTEYDFNCTAATLRQDLKELMHHQLIYKKTRDYEPSNDLSYTESHPLSRIYYGSHSLIALDEHTISGYRKSIEGKNASPSESTFFPRVQLPAMDSLNRKLAFFFPDSSEKKSNQLRTGKSNVISAEAEERLSFLRKYDFKHYRIRIVYRSYKNELIQSDFSTGLVVYSVETNRIYLMGRDADYNYTIIALDTIDLEKTAKANQNHPSFGRSSSEICQLNRIYDSLEFRKIFTQMMNVSTEEPLKVKIRFRNLPYVRERVYRLKKVRGSSAAVTLSDDSKELLYTDTIRGLEDLARYLRGFGSNVRVEEPEALKDRMRLTAEKLLELYSEKEDEQHG